MAKVAPCGDWQRDRFVAVQPKKTAIGGEKQVDGIMVKGSTPKSTQVNSLDRYTCTWRSGGRRRIEPLGKPSLSTIMAAIQDIQGFISPLELKLDAVHIDVKLLRADIGKISEKGAMQKHT
ncbi:hypothetical protein NDU88_002236 [Pleurodeles waltl]|uniref:Uncharacterized protein n=1 Tax=Pleurodeles waltl TaxID=8319 RepID=A0AAV7SD51_PLEWA|nr:hypothetical protein NDU88_002236 [Pleurodeles waltl]